MAQLSVPARVMWGCLFPPPSVHRAHPDVPSLGTGPHTSLLVAFGLPHASPTSPLCPQAGRWHLPRGRLRAGTPSWQ